MGNSHEKSISPWGDDMTSLRMGGLLSEASVLGKISDSELKSSGSKMDLLPISLSTDISIGGLLSEASLQGRLCNKEPVLNERHMDHEQAPIQWDDCLTALSIGGLLSEASLQAKINKYNPKSIARDMVGHPSTFIGDSFDAIITSQMKSNPQVAKPSSLDAHSSILDAEETCHAFSFRKFSSSSKNVRVSTRASQDSSSNSFRFPDVPEVDNLAVNAQDAACQEPKMELFPRPQQYNEDSRSLGLRGITWNESLGPFDLGISTLRKGSGGDRSTSRDVLQI